MGLSAVKAAVSVPEEQKRSESSFVVTSLSFVGMRGSLDVEMEVPDMVSISVLLMSVAPLVLDEDVFIVL